MSYRILHGNALEVLRRLPDSVVDCVIADPPYGETSLEWDRPVKGWAKEVQRVLRPLGSMWVFGSLRHFMEHADEFSGWRMAQDLVWEKHNGSNAFNDRFRRVHELIAQFYPDGRPWSGIYKRPLFSNDATARTIRRKTKPQQWGRIGEARYESEDGGPRLLRSVLYHRSEHGRAIHPTQKPVGIIAALLEYSCPPGGVVLDPFVGSGTTLVAAESSGRHGIGIEADEEMAAKAETRLRGSAPLFEASELTALASAASIPPTGGGAE